MTDDNGPLQSSCISTTFGREPEQAPNARQDIELMQDECATSRTRWIQNCTQNGYGRLTLTACVIVVQVDGHEVLVDCSTGKVQSTNADLGVRVQSSVNRMMEVLRPVDLSIDLQH